MRFENPRCNSLTNFAWVLEMGEPISILRRKQVESRTGLSRSTIYERIKRGAFPTPISLGAKAVGWIEAEVETWLSEQVSMSRIASEDGRARCER